MTDTPDFPELTPELQEYWETLVHVMGPAADDHLKLAADTLAKRDARDRAVEQEIASSWVDGWRYFDAVLNAMEQSTLVMIERANITEDAHAPVREALLLLQASATTTTHEIRRLLLSGLWAGGAARWRALHEIAVTATLVAKGGPKVAERFTDHAFVVQTKRLLDFYNEHGHGPVPKTELDERWQRAQSLISRHEQQADPVRFPAPYAWALPLLQPGRSGRASRPTFDGLEALANMSDLRQLVSTSNGMVHNDAAGLVATIIHDDGYVLSPNARFINTVARPTLITLTRLIPATHLGFEPELDEFAKVLGLLGAAIGENARRGIDAFETPSTTTDRD